MRGERSRRLALPHCGNLLIEQSTPRHNDLNAGIWIRAVRRAMFFMAQPPPEFKHKLFTSVLTGVRQDSSGDEKGSPLSGSLPARGERGQTWPQRSILGRIYFCLAKTGRRRILFHTAR